MTAPQNGLWFAVAGFVVGLLVVVILELRSRRRGRRREAPSEATAEARTATGHRGEPAANELDARPGGADLPVMENGDRPEVRRTEPED